jgi:hypothetical protein
MMNLLGRLFTWLVLTASAGFAPAALAACPPDCPFSYNYGFTLTLNTQAELGGDIYANWDMEATRLLGAPLTVGASLSVPYSLSASSDIQPPGGNLHIQVTPTVAGYPVDLGVALVYRYKRDDARDLVYEAYAGPLIFSSEGRSWNAIVTLVDSRWFNNSFAPPPVFVPTFDFARLTITPVPEPETFSMLLAGLGVVGLMARRRSKVAMV